jgi:ADP-dependent phosphofructokinase/glucokinase
MTVILVIAMIFATIFNAILKGKPLHLEGFKQDVEDDMNELSNYIDSSKGKTTKLFGEETDEEPSSNKSTKSFSGNASPTPTKLMESLRENALDLQDTQKNIISGFQQIEPHMDRAEELLETIQHTAETIKKMKDSQ